MQPLCDLARTIVAANGFSNVVELHGLRSDELVLSDTEKADLCVTEIFDSELLGEGI